MSLNYNRTAIPQVELNRFLELTWDRALNWSSHINCIRSLCVNRLNIMKMTAGTHWGADCKYLILFYRAYFRSVREFGEFLRPLPYPDSLRPGTPPRFEAGVGRCQEVSLCQFLSRSPRTPSSTSTVLTDDYVPFTEPSAFPIFPTRGPPEGCQKGGNLKCWHVCFWIGWPGHSFLFQRPLINRVFFPLIAKWRISILLILVWWFLIVSVKVSLNLNVLYI